METIRTTTQARLANLPVAQLQELCQQVGLDYEAPRANAARLLKQHMAEADQRARGQLPGGQDQGQEEDGLPGEVQPEPVAAQQGHQEQLPAAVQPGPVATAGAGPDPEGQASVQQLLNTVLMLQGTILKLQETQNSMVAEKELSKSWPELDFDRPRDQHEWDALREIAADLTPLRSANLAAIGVAKVQDKIKAALEKVEKRAAMIYVGSHEGWATAAHIDDTAGTFLEEFKPQIKEARLKRKAEEKGKGWFFQAGKGKGKKRKWDYSQSSRSHDQDSRSSYQERDSSRDRGGSSQSSSSRPDQPYKKKAVACFNCGGPHYADKCPKRKEQPSRAAQS
jgi:hypothetical protein